MPLKTGNDNFVDAIIKSLKVWQEINGKIIVGLDGTSGIGKTTIAKQVAIKNPNITVVHLDHFSYPLTQRLKQLKTTKDKPTIYEKGWYNANELKQLLKIYKNSGRKKTFTKKIITPSTKKLTKIKYDLKNPTLLVEGVFLQNKELFGDIFDRQIFLITDPETVNTRRAKRSDSNKSKGSNQEAMRLIFEIAWQRYQFRENPEKKADLVIKMLIKRSG